MVFWLIPSAKPIKSLKLHHPMIQVLINVNIYKYIEGQTKFNVPWLIDIITITMLTIFGIKHYHLVKTRPNP